mmetsp:Transcript_46977/g.110608  ORF Transcript_46977/g.110608 Transcript_46977/m.110608 type:complete len:237 (-) Transcript_46977:792-1502(-)
MRRAKIEYGHLNVSPETNLFDSTIPIIKNGIPLLYPPFYSRTLTPPRTQPTHPRLCGALSAKVEAVGCVVVCGCARGWERHLPRPGSVHPRSKVLRRPRIVGVEADVACAGLDELGTGRGGAAGELRAGCFTAVERIVLEQHRLVGHRHTALGVGMVGSTRDLGDADVAGDGVGLGVVRGQGVVSRHGELAQRVGATLTRRHRRQWDRVDRPFLRSRYRLWHIVCNLPLKVVHLVE